MAVKTYAQLMAAVKAYAQRDDIPQATWDLFLRNAEARIYRILRVPIMERVLTIEVGEAQPYIVVPNDLLQVKLVWCDEYPDLTRIDESTRLAKIAKQPSAAGGPRYFSRHNNQFNFFPSAAGMTIGITYWAETEGLSEDIQITALLSIAFDAFIFGIMVEVMTFTHYDERMSMWEARFRTALGEIQEMADRAEFAGSIKQEETDSLDIGIY